MNDTDCKDTQYCDIPAGAKGGDCKDIQARGLIANHTVAIPYQCGDSAACPACPQNQACVDHICVSYNLTGPEHSFVGENATLNATNKPPMAILMGFFITKFFTDSE